MKQFKQLRIRAYLQTGIISDQFLPLDGVLYYHKVRDIMGRQTTTRPGQSNIREGAGIMLPIKKAGPKDNAWFYHISFAQWPVNFVEDRAFFVKRFDVKHSHYISQKTKKVNIKSGQYKPYHIHVTYRHAEYVEWYCIGIKPEIEALLRFVTHLGKKTAQGWGAVKNWEVIEWPEDWGIRGPQNKLMRAVPVINSPYLYGLRPSYWNPRHVFPCKMPD